LARQYLGFGRFILISDIRLVGVGKLLCSQKTA